MKPRKVRIFWSEFGHPPEKDSIFSLSISPDELGMVPRVRKMMGVRAHWVLSQIQNRDGFLSHPSLSSPHFTIFNKDSLPLPTSQPPPEPPPSSSSSRISPAVLFIIVILAVIFFISGLLHLLVRFLIKKNPSASNQSNGYPLAEVSDSEALQRQLQQLFHLHDSGLDQAFIDALPVFLYKEIVGTKEPFDCAVCLCEFTPEDRLRLLPLCSHAFHLNCIDTWLLSNSTCPLCRGALFVPGLAIENPIFDVEDPREEGRSGDRDDGSSLPTAKDVEEIMAEKRVFPVRLGKFRRLSNGDNASDGDAAVTGGDANVNDGKDEGESSSSNLDARRCYSMGSYQYVVGDANLGVPLTSSGIRIGDHHSIGRGRRLSANGNSNADAIEEGKRLGIGSRGESFSVSKIWLWSNKKGKFPISSDAPSLDGSLPWMKRGIGDT